LNKTQTYDLVFPTLPRRSDTVYDSVLANGFMRATEKISDNLHETSRELRKKSFFFSEDKKERERERERVDSHIHIYNSMSIDLLSGKLIQLKLQFKREEKNRPFSSFMCI